MKKVFLICPVREASPEVRNRMEAYVANLESDGYKVHLPHRDTNQEDETGGYVICKTNFQAILEADEIHIWYDETSAGSKFDMGGVFMLVAMLGHKKKIVLVNKDEVVDEKKKSFFKVFTHLELDNPKLTPTVCTGIINYLDPVDSKLSQLVGGIYSDGKNYLFLFTPDMFSKIKMGDKVKFSLNKEGGAVLDI